MQGSTQGWSRLPAVVALDGDDTLWHNETAFAASHDRFRDLLGRHVDLPAAEVDALLLATERRNLSAYGYGVKGFTLSMVETAIAVTGGRIPAAEIQEILDLGRAMLAHPVELLDGVREAVDRLRAAGLPLWIITKGDLFDQESKIARSGLADLFQHVEIVSEKDPDTYGRLLERNGIPPRDFLMAGNSLRSDVLPVLALGGRAVHVPYALTWAHEVVDEAPTDGFATLDSLRDLPDLLGL
ncbi:HAD family hydrolase [Oleisolibacter albus]|uniref:HAD family hydrolase n=1 Tax=Oleisolibacter albus TaxID=2171757 RepID=UPI000DF446F8|nr:HAD family hydrolase [Oleisolibacter albus]